MFEFEYKYHEEIFPMKNYACRQNCVIVELGESGPINTTSYVKTTRGK